MVRLDPWAAPALIAAALVFASAAYSLVRWRRAPVAFRAIRAVAGLCFLAGFFAGLWSFHFYDEHLGLAASVAPSSQAQPSPSSTPSDTAAKSDFDGERMKIRSQVCAYIKDIRAKMGDDNATQWIQSEAQTFKAMGMDMPVYSDANLKNFNENSIPSRKEILLDREVIKLADGGWTCN